MKVPGRFKSEDLHHSVNVNERTGRTCQRRFFQGVTGGRFLESSKRQTHIAGSVLIYVCVLDGNVTVGNIDAATLRNQGKCQRRVFQGVPGGRFQEGSRSEYLLPVNVNSNAQKGNVRESSSRGSLEESSGKVQQARTYIAL